MNDNKTIQVSTKPKDSGKVSSKVRAAIARIVAMDKKEIEKQWADQKDIDGKAKLRTELTEDGTIVIARFKGTGQKAWIAEFGKGSLMDKESDNPYLAGYKSSTQWNPMRNQSGYSVRGRPKGEYTDLDGKTHTSSGKAAKGAYGLNLEKGLVPHSNDHKYEPKAGQHIMKNVLLNTDTGIHKLLELKLGDVVREAINGAVKNGTK